MTKPFRTARAKFFHLWNKAKVDLDLAARQQIERSVSFLANPLTQVTAFHNFYQQPNNLGKLTQRMEYITDERLNMRYDLLAEELQELYIAAFDRDVYEIADALGDIVYLAYGMAIECGIDLTSVLAEIHCSNLTKMGKDGKPLLREDGKVFKGPDYMPPALDKVLIFNKSTTEETNDD